MTVQKPLMAALLWFLLCAAGAGPAAARPLAQVPTGVAARHPLRAMRGQIAGAWQSAGPGPALYSRGLWYDLAFRPSVVLPAAARITTVHWSWGLSRIPAGLDVRLCWMTNQHCVTISARQSGDTRAFAGLSAAGPAILAFRVRGTAAMLPVYGAADQIIVNYIVG